MESLLLQVDEKSRILGPMIADQVQALANLYKIGAWTDDPGQMDLTKIKSSIHREIAVMERQLWTSSATDVLIEFVNAWSGWDLDRGMLLKAARHRAAQKGGKFILVK